MAEQKLMKDGLNKQAVARIAKSISVVYEEFSAKNFESYCLRTINSLELKERVTYIIEALGLYLPNDFEETAKLLQALPAHWDRGDRDDSLSGFAAWPLIDYVAVYGLDHPEAALKTLEKLTPLFSAEFAIRPFLESHEKVTFNAMQRWINHPEEHVRRLVSEGCRPLLPWGKKLQKFVENPNKILPFLDKLKADKSLYVRRSVANNLNDIAKHHPELVLDICFDWREKVEHTENNEKIEWVISQATRTLVKQGHPRSFELLGYTKKPSYTAIELTLNRDSVYVGEEIEITLKACSEKKQKIVLDYAIHFLKANGTHSPKVFKWKNLTTKKGEQISLTKKQSFKPVTTRKLYLGKHFIAVHINGKEMTRTSFELL